MCVWLCPCPGCHLADGLCSEALPADPLQIPKTFTESDIRELFKAYGDIVHINVRSGGGAMQSEQRVNT